MKRIISLSVFTLLLLVSQSFSLQAQTRDIGNFNAVKTSGSVSVKLEKADSPGLKYKMLKGDESDLITTVSDGVLSIKIKGKGLFSRGYAKAKLVVYFTELESIKSSAGSSVTSEDVIIADNLELSASSGASVRVIVEASELTASSSSGATLSIEGSTDKVKMGASSGASVSAGDLIANKVKASASSGASVSCHANKKIVAKSSSGGSVTYSGNPEDKEIDKSV